MKNWLPSNLQRHRTTLQFSRNHWAVQKDYWCSWGVFLYKMCSCTSWHPRQGRYLLNICKKKAILLIKKKKKKRKSTSWQGASVRVCRIWCKQVINTEIIFLCFQVELWSGWRWRCLRAWVCSLPIKWQQYHQVLKVKNSRGNSALQHKTPSPTQSALVWNHSPWQEALHGPVSSWLSNLHISPSHWH